MFGFFILLAYWLAGEYLVYLFAWPIPGSVVGLLALWLTLVALQRVPDSLKNTSSTLLRYLTLLFVPAGVGLIEHWPLLMRSGIWILLIITASTLFTATAMIIIFKAFGTK
ncbi:CidA/LrgA family protein [Gynuella sp.]|uniref:CidA/LrgA family protein n=1 Tax=Gynuella sp. TaxID=2969146 RepID=UPI003D0C1026